MLLLFFQLIFLSNKNLKSAKISYQKCVYFILIPNFLLDCLLFEKKNVSLQI